jgi:ureidoacrylate peracid hydrolase
MPNLQRLLEPSGTVVLVIDVQNDFCSPDGATARSGRSVQKCSDIIPRLTQLVDEARESGVNVIFIRTIGTRWTGSDAWLYRASDKPRTGNCREGTWGAEFYGVLPRADEAVVVKHRNSAFYNTSLDSILRTLKTSTVVVAGVATNVSVETTARDAVQRDYNVVLVEDCSGAYDQAAHDATLYNIRNFFGAVASCSDVIGIWGGYRNPT